MTPGAYRGLRRRVGVHAAAPGRLSRGGDPRVSRARSREPLRARPKARRSSRRSRLDGDAAVLEIVARAAGRVVPRSLGSASSRARASRPCMPSRSGCSASTLDVAAFETRAARDPRMAALLARRPRAALAAHAEWVRRRCAGRSSASRSTSRSRARCGASCSISRARRSAACVAHPRAERVAEIAVDELRSAGVLALEGRISRSALRKPSRPGGLPASACRRLRRHGRARAHTHSRHRHLDRALHADARRRLRGLRAGRRRRARRRVAEAHGGRASARRRSEVEELMRPFAPHRSLATIHLWASLRDAA